MDPVVFLDLIFTSVKPYSWFVDQTEQVNAKVKLVNSNKTLTGEWADGFSINNFFSKEYTNTLAITNSIVKCSDEQSRHVHVVNPTYYGMYYCNYRVDDTPIQKDFNFFVNRFDIFRQSWMYQLIRRGMFERGYISFNNASSKGKEFRQEFLGLSGQDIFESSFQKFNSIFAEEHEFIKNQIPYKNFKDTGDLTSIIMASKFSIVLETYFHDNRIITYSEKIFRCLQLPRPWVLFSTQYAVDNLRQLGFDVLDDIVDHNSYDQVPDIVQRQIAVLDLCKNLQLLNMSDIADRCSQAAENNKSVLKSMNDVWLINIMEDFKQAQQKLIDL